MGRNFETHFLRQLELFFHFRSVCINLGSQAKPYQTKPRHGDHGNHVDHGLHPGYNSGYVNDDLNSHSLYLDYNPKDDDDNDNHDHHSHHDHDHDKD